MANHFELADRPLPLSSCGTIQTTAGGTTYVCVNDPCNGEGHYFVRANA